MGPIGSAKPFYSFETHEIHNLHLYPLFCTPIDYFILLILVLSLKTLFTFDEFRRTHQKISISAPKKSAACESAGTETAESGDSLYLA